MIYTHILPEVEAVCDRAVIIARGKIVAQGTPDELRHSRQMQARVLVECKGPPTDVENTLARVAGVSKVQILGTGDGNGAAGYTTAALRPADGRDVREEVARTVIQHGWPLREIRLEAATLEEFFVQVTANQAAGEGDELRVTTGE